MRACLHSTPAKPSAARRSLPRGVPCSWRSSVAGGAAADGAARVGPAQRAVGREGGRARAVRVAGDLRAAAAMPCQLGSCLRALTPFAAAGAGESQGSTQAAHLYGPSTCTTKQQGHTTDLSVAQRRAVVAAQVLSSCSDDAPRATTAVSHLSCFAQLYATEPSQWDTLCCPSWDFNKI